MPLRVHHLDCGTMCPVAGKLVNHRGTMVCHCLLVETDRGLVLVDSGVSTADMANPKGRLGAPFMAMTGLRLDPETTAIAQVKRLGFSPADVRHVVLTHLDLDHAGGITDFPHAKIHSHSDEQAAALAQASLVDRNRYRACHFTHGPDWAIYRDVAGGEPWNGFSAVRDLVGLPPEILAVPLPGHTVGHAAIAVDAEGGWLLHAGDAYFHAATVDPRRGSVSIGATLFERAVAVDYAKVRQNHARLRALAESGAARVFSAHDPDEFDTRRRALAS